MTKKSLLGADFSGFSAFGPIISYMIQLSIIIAISITIIIYTIIIFIYIYICDRYTHIYILYLNIYIEIKPQLIQLIRKPQVI